MATKSITITNEAYRYLKDIKGERSFSEVILSLSRRSEDVLGYAGALKKADFKSIERVREAANRDWADRR
jgi:predicted CopG family antitoxin